MNHRSEMNRFVMRNAGIHIAVFDCLQNPEILHGVPCFLDNERSDAGRETENPTKEQTGGCGTAAFTQAESASVAREMGMSSSGSGKQIPAAAPPEISPVKVRRKTLQGISIAAGLGVGRIFHYRDIMTRRLETRNLEPHEIGSEMQRIEEAIRKVKEDLRVTRERVAHEIGRFHAGIFDTHVSILDDSELLNSIRGCLEERRVNGEKIISDVFLQFEQRFKNSGDMILRERSVDLHDIGRRILNVLTGIEENILSEIPPDSIILAKRLLPSDTIHFARKKPVAFITEEGGPGSHSAIIANAFEIPSVSKILFSFDDILDGTDAIVDGRRGRIIIHPGPDEKQECAVQISRNRQCRGVLLRRFKKRTLEYHGEPVQVHANVDSKSDVRNALRFGCDGIGLYRLEPLYMANSCMPREDELFNQISYSLEGVEGKDVVLRLPDFGGDKLVSYLEMKRERVSALGIRGIRFLLRYPALLRSQLRVSLRLSTSYAIKILIPMVTICDDVKEVAKHLDSVRSELLEEGVAVPEHVPLGAMLETPSSILDLERILDHVDFVSIGTNDLIQYTMAADRENLDVVHYYQSGSRLVLEMISQAASLAKRRGKECGICGEMAGDFRLIPQLISCNLRNFSVAPPRIPIIKEHLYQALKKIKP